MLGQLMLTSGGQLSRDHRSWTHQVNHGHANTFLVLVRKLPGNPTYTSALSNYLDKYERNRKIYHNFLFIKTTDLFLLILGARDIVFRMLDLNPRTRWSFEELKYHPWLAPPGLSPISLMYHGIVPSSCNIVSKNYATGKYLLLNMDSEHSQGSCSGPVF